MTGTTGDSPLGASLGAIGRTMDGERLLILLTKIVDVLGHALPHGTEVVLHDLGKLPNSVVAISGSVTGRSVGGSAAEVLVERITAAEEDELLGYESTLPDGRWIRSSALIVRDVSGTAVAALCINTEMSLWRSVDRIVSSMLGLPPREESAPSSRVAEPVPATSRSLERAAFTEGIDSFADLMIARQVAAIGVPVDSMRKSHKIAVVASLRDRGVFELRGAVRQVAEALEVSRFTIYNYLNELGDKRVPESGDEQ
ncbi:hypothetical protein G4X40_21085 [Rhodococcus sp. D2-41]|uniref:helix-turn-helix transcriptional regulator n=1 Tax=Speluncibacter jeojiensis TaxID=2710754 RepID=UPI00240FF6F5|nr:PAS domain-containing protein [Rhodococcus sp. D2-41]MDG3012639.1 hypothetical protein [Rhodococcus sp. D2-41]